MASCTAIMLTRESDGGRTIVIAVEGKVIAGIGVLGASHFQHIEIPGVNSEQYIGAMVARYGYVENERKTWDADLPVSSSAPAPEPEEPMFPTDDDLK